MKSSRRKFLQTSGAVAAALAAGGCDTAWDRAADFLGPGLWPVRKDDGPFETTSSETIDLITHVLNRLSFGPAPGDYERVRKMAREPEAAVDAYIEEQLAPEKISDREAEFAVRRFESLTEPRGELFEYNETVLLSEMTRATVLRAALSRRQLYEVMVQFWTDHFNIDPSKGDCKWLKADDDRSVIRKHALGSFPEMLRASALSPAMLWYLDGRDNKKAQGNDKPNENYARELMELHTLGVHGGYTQKDVMEVARCLTGWTVRSKGFMKIGTVEFKRDQHDAGPKEVLGQAIPAGLGERDMDRVMEILSLHPSTADHIAQKLCRRFISEEPSNESVSQVAGVFLESRGDIKMTLREVFRSSEFRASAGLKFKRPFNYLVSAIRATRAQTDSGAPLLDYLQRMGHSPFQYPTPDGYPEESAPWTGTLLWRWNFAYAFSQNRINGTRIKEAELKRACRGETGLMTHLLGRRPTSEEVKSYRDSGAGLALMLASPGFQRC